MAESRRHRLATRAYAPQPVRSPARRWAARLLLGLAGAALGAAATGWQLPRAVPPAAASTEAPTDDELRATLARTRLALAQQEAEGAALRKAVASAAVEARRLDTEVRFLRGQRATSQP